MSSNGIIKHQIYREGSEELAKEMSDFRPGHMIALLGPSGVGKSTMRHECMREQFGHPQHWGLGRIPITEIYPTLASNGYFSPRAFSERFLDALQAPNLAWLHDKDKWAREMKMEIEEKRAQWTRLKRRSATEREYWDGVEQALAARSCLYVSIEQITTLMYNRANIEPSSHVLNLLNIAEHCKIMFLVTGIHTAAAMWRNFPEMRRRVTPVWVRNYSPDCKGDEVAFIRLLKTMSAHLKFSTPNLLADMAPDIMAATGGVVGEMAKLLKKAQSTATLAGSTTIAQSHIESSYYNTLDLQNLWLGLGEFKTASASGSVAERSKNVRKAWARNRGGAG
jgi:hypothetical protein